MIDLILGLLINILVIYAFLHINKLNAQKIRLSIASLISTIIVAVIPGLGYRFDKSLGDYYFGFPADVLVYHGGMLFSFGSFGFLFNFFFIYWMYKLLVKLTVLIMPLNKGE